MSEFAAGDITILVSTSVIEVGIDVPNATIMVIEGAERFGLAQLHQLRGRVGRSHQHSWCFLFPTEDTANTRLTYFASHSDGLKIAEYDLEQRGPGEVYGTRQSGIPNLKIARLNDLSLIKEAKKVADLFFESRIKQIDLF
jgi:ATP-dependent DNA helicase RecG